MCLFHRLVHDVQVQLYTYNVCSLLGGTWVGGHCTACLHGLANAEGLIHIGSSDRYLLAVCMSYVLVDTIV